MNQAKISKKELLRKTGISYGQFYRWKRKGLIPEKWLLHESTRTGQESFLPEKKILPRIEKIKELKEDNSLQEIAELLSPELVEKKYDRGDLLRLTWIDRQLIRAYEAVVAVGGFYSFEDLLNLTVFHRLKASGIDSDMIYLAIKTLSELDHGASRVEGKLILAKKREDLARKTERPPREDGGFCLVANGEFYFDRTIEIEETLNLSEIISDVKLKLREKSSIDEVDLDASKA